jgi:hypothetical protein
MHLPTGSTRLTIAAAGRSFPRRRLSLGTRALLTGFVDLGCTVTIFLQMCPDEVKVTFEGGFDVSDSCMDGIVNGLKELSNLVDAE